MAKLNVVVAEHSKVKDADWEICASVLNGINIKEGYRVGGNPAPRLFGH